MKIITPLFVDLPRKTKKDKRIYLNLNVYRNLHYILSNQAKESFSEALYEKLSGKRLITPVSIEFVLYKASRRKLDRSNILCIIEKYFCDALTKYGCIEDDNDDYISQTIYRTGGVDKDNPRCEINIIETLPTNKDLLTPYHVSVK